MIFLTYKGLVTRKVETVRYDSGQLEAMTEQLKRLPSDLCKFQTLSPDVAATLQLSISSALETDDRDGGIEAIVSKCIAMLGPEGGDLGARQVNALRKNLRELESQIVSFKNKSEKGDVQAAADIVNSIERLTVDIEMQRKKQEIIEARVLQYGAIMLLSQHAPNLLPLVLISICEWENESGEIVNDAFHARIGKNSRKPMSISLMTINILGGMWPVDLSGDERKNERKRVKDIYKASLRRRYPELIKEDESFKSLWQQEGDSPEITAKKNLRTAYEVLCFLRLAPLTPQLGDEGYDKALNPDNTKPLDDYQRQTRIFNPIIREAYNLMDINNVKVPGAQEQYLDIWSAKNKIMKIQQNAVDTLIGTLELIRFIPDEQRREAITQWAHKTFLNPKNLGIRQATIDQIERRQGEFGKDVVAILRREYNQTAPGIPATPSRPGDSGSPARTTSTTEDFRFTTPPRSAGIGPHPSPMTRRGSGSPERPLKTTEATEPPISPLPDCEIKVLADKVASYLRTCTKDLKEGDVVSYIYGEGLPLSESTLRAIVAKLRKDPQYKDVPGDGIGVFNRGITWAIKPR
jgi:hypothetical protein